jgi:hypothetical protein
MGLKRSVFSFHGGFAANGNQKQSKYFELFALKTG